MNVPSSSGYPELRRRPSDLTASFITSTNSTTSELLGPGRIVGKLLAGSGRRLESFLGRTAERLGFGAAAIVSRLLTLLREQHHRLHHATCKAEAPPAARLNNAPPELDTLLDEIIELGNISCATCDVPYFLNVALNKEATDLLSKLTGLMR